MFASNTLTEHILRGAAGIGALWFAVAIAATHPWSSLAPGGLALLAFRGCPICWMVGLFETARLRCRRQALSRQSRGSRAAP